MFLLKILVFIAALIIGLVLMIYTEPLIRTFGKADWAEAKFGTMGGTYLLWKLIGIIIIIIGFLFMVGTLDGFFRI